MSRADAFSFQESQALGAAGYEVTQDYYVRGILADNDTGSWYQVYAGSSVPSHLPPYTYGWQLTVKVASFRVQFVQWAGPTVMPSTTSPSDTGVRGLLTEEELPTRIGYNTLSGAISFQGSFQTLAKVQVISVGTAAVLIPTFPMIGRLGFMVQAAPDNVRQIYIGGDTGVTADETTTGGFQIFPGQTFPIDASNGCAWYAICTAGPAQKLIVGEAK